MRTRVAGLWLLLTGAAAGAAGTTALHAATYLDMAVRGRPASSTPERSIEHLADLVHLRVAGEGRARENRLTGLGALGGIATGLVVGVAYGAACGIGRRLGRRPGPVAGGLLTAAAAMVAANGPMAVAGVSDPRSWTRADWASDVLPHLAFGLVTAATYEAMYDAM